VFFNHNNILDGLNSTQLTSVKYHSDGPPVLYGCHNLDASAFQFTHDGAFVKVEHQATLGGDTLEIALSLRTLKPDCMISYTESAAPMDRGYIQVGLGKIHLGNSLD